MVYGFCLFFSFVIVPLQLWRRFPYTTLFRSSSGDARSQTVIAARRSSANVSGDATSPPPVARTIGLPSRSEEHTSELRSPCNLVCRLLLEKKNRLSIYLDHIWNKI